MFAINENYSLSCTIDVSMGYRLESAGHELDGLVDVSTKALFALLAKLMLSRLSHYNAVMPYSALNNNQ